MSRRFYDLLQRATRVRTLIEEEQRRRVPDLLRLMRLKALALKLKERLNGQLGARLVAMASAPRFTPRLAALDGRRL